MEPDALGLHAARALEEKILELGPDRVAAFIGEPIQGAGGVIVPPASYWPEVQRICVEYDVLLIADEVICGFGRTGPWFGCETFGFAPDLMTIAKGVTSSYVPLSAVLLGDRVADVLSVADDEFAHGFTYSGHPVACAVALEKHPHPGERGHRRYRSAEDRSLSAGSVAGTGGPSAGRRGARHRDDRCDRACRRQGLAHALRSRLEGGGQVSGPLH